MKPMKPLITIFFFFFFFDLAIISSSSCPPLLQAFSSVANFPRPTPPCSQIHHLLLPSRNLSGPVSWSLLSRLPSLRSLDLSSNSLSGSIPSPFFSSSPSLTHLNLSRNLLGGPLRFEPGPSRLTHLDLSFNRFTSVPPSGFAELEQLEYLDVSNNLLSGAFQADFPEAHRRLRFLNVSFNNLTGDVDPAAVRKFGASAFLSSGASLSSPPHKEGAKRQHEPKRAAAAAHKKGANKLVLLITTVAASVIVTLALFCAAGIVVIIKRRRRRKAKGWEEEEKGVRSASEVPEWVVAARWSAPVMVFEKPLMELTFADLAEATSGFGREAMLAEGGRSGAAYRAAVGGMEVVVRMVSTATEEAEAAAEYREVARLRHPNLLPLLGYCIAGEEKLLLYEYMERGDLHQWLHELPAGSPSDTENFIGDDDSFEPHQLPTAYTKRTAAAAEWPTRHKIALGIARGLAFLHQGWAGPGSSQPIVHGRLVPSNILLDEYLDPRISDFTSGGGGETTEGNVYSFGVLVMELVTGRGKWSGEEVEKVRRSVRDGKGFKEVDFRMKDVGNERRWEKEMVECLRVGYLCTAQAPDKRPTMQQVVGLLKDIRPSSTSSGASSSSFSGRMIDPK